MWPVSPWPDTREFSWKRTRSDFVLVCRKVRISYYNMPLIPYLHQVADRRDLGSAEAQAAMGIILTGQSTPSEIGAFLIALKMKGETVGELVGFARAMRQAATAVRVDGTAPLIDTCGTGGDGGGTFNISTVAAFAIAGAGVRVAKHGNPSLSS